MGTNKLTYLARLIYLGKVHQEIEFEATDDDSAWNIANDGINPLRGIWVEVKQKPDPQQILDL